MMNLKFFLPILIFLINVSSTLAQSEYISANYTLLYDYYYAHLTINNPNGLNNFNEIIGMDHMIGKSDNDVRVINRMTKTVSTNIPSIICQKYKNAINIDLQLIGFERIDDYSFNGCKNVTGIYLYGNKIATIHEKSFAENFMLQTLSLSNNKLTTLPENLFVNQQRLENLQLDGNLLLNIPNYIFRPLISLKYLYLRNMQLTTIKSEWFETLGMLKTLDLQSNQIEVLPVYIFIALENLASLYLTSNKLKIINSNFFGLIHKLTYVDLRSNQISAIDEKFIDNSPLITLMMQTNLCSNVNAYNGNKTIIKQGLQVCFDNFETIKSTTTTTMPPPSCNIADPTAELCDIKVKIRAVEGNLTSIVQNAFDLINYQRDRITKNENDIKDLKATVSQQQISLDEKDASIAAIREEIKQFQSSSNNNDINAEIQNMQANINFLLSRSCTCN
ncbi:unnamed protein product [Chironomus riparius]|uniref:Uncharacterized protein n=1 Tax=Chironomus riparius TaxID=315576 RepID=A0A9N9RL46_9DIPT|nr:unnamed protein product [Chironomus riparius]